MRYAQPDQQPSIAKLEAMIADKAAKDPSKFGIGVEAIQAAEKRAEFDGRVNFKVEQLKINQAAKQRVAEEEFEQVYGQFQPDSWNVADLLESDDDEPEIIEGLLTVGEQLTLAAYTGKGKSTLGFELEAALVKGTSFMGWNIPRPWRVIRFDGENPRRVVRRNVRARGLVPDDDYRVYSTRRAPRLLDTEFGYEWAREALREFKAGPDTILIVDNLDRFSVFEDPYKPSEMNRFCLEMRRLVAEFDLAAWVLHQHSPRDDYRPANSQATENNFAVVLGFQQTSDFGSTLHVLKCRSFAAQSKTKLTWDPEDWEHKLLSTNPIEGVVPLADQILETVAIHPGLKRTTLRTEHFDPKYNRKQSGEWTRALNQLLGSGKIIERDGRLYPASGAAT